VSTSIEPILGWRIWHVIPRRQGALLASWSQSVDWPAGERMEAGCRGRLGFGWRHDHEAPHRGHLCGIYALRDRGEAVGMLRELEQGAPWKPRPAAIGRVSLWGRVIENTGGWRAQFAYPYDLTLYRGNDRIARELRERYAVDVALAT
jgi:hypothetical protein